jgi:hypothetical protein
MTRETRQSTRVLFAMGGLVSAALVALTVSTSRPSAPQGGAVTSEVAEVAAAGPRTAPALDLDPAGDETAGSGEPYIAPPLAAPVIPPPAMADPSSPPQGTPTLAAPGPLVMPDPDRAPRMDPDIHAGR